MSAEFVCDGQDSRCQICGKHKSCCACLRHLDDGSTSPRHTQAHATHHELRWRHSHWWARRERVIAAMKLADVSWAKREAFDHCGACARTQWSPSEGRRRITGSFCKNRNCEPCMRAKANCIARNLEAKLRDTAASKYRFLTLTLKHSKQPLADQIKRLYKAFRKLRSSAWWKDRVHGGAATLEVKLTDTGWHPHLHAVIDAAWIQQNELADRWHAVTGDSFIVDIRELKDAHDASYYVAKYVTKATSPNVWSDDTAAIEWLRACKGVRTAVTFGTWRGYRLTAKPNDPGDWETEDTLDTLIARAAEGDQVATDILISLRPPGTKDAIDWQ